MKAGQVVYSKRGRDSGRMFVVLSVEGDFVYLIDGEMRPLAKPKKKKIKHIQLTQNSVDLSAAGPRGANDADIRKWLSRFKSKED